MQENNEIDVGLIVAVIMLIIMIGFSGVLIGSMMVKREAVIMGHAKYINNDFQWNIISPLKKENNEH